MTDPSSPIATDDHSLRVAYRRAVDRFEAEFHRDAPYAWEQIGPWIYQGIHDGDLSSPWLKPRGFPLLSLPRWFLGSIGASVDAEFIADLDHSSVNGYYFVRLIDEVMDSELQFHPRILPAAAFMHARFQGAFIPHFDRSSAFWPFFRTVWDEHVEVTMRDAFLEQIDEEQFRNITGRKFTAAQIPIAAAALRVGTIDRAEPWLRLCAPLGRWQQMLNDLFDWHYDREHGTRTWIQSEAERRAIPGEPLDGWFAREGFQWGRGMVDRFHHDVIAIAAELGSAPLDDYLARRKIEVDADLDQAADGVEALAAIAEALG